VLRLYDTATGTVHPLELRTEGEVSMYVCGPTVYDMPHIGHGRANLTFDILRRYLSFTGLRVHHVANVTDVDDNIIRRAAALGRTEPDVAAEFEARWWESMDALGDLRPHDTPHATGYIERMVDLVGDLVDKGVAYETPDGVYLEVSKVDGYGLLAHQPLASLQAGARVEANEDKRSPLDFALWKKAKEGEPSWESPWGPGRPGWHTECVVMSLDLLGEGFDLHGGGQDLMFPHHENERAQAVADGKVFAQHWMHHGWVEVEGTKMSKSLGNFSTLPDLLSRSDPRAYRLLVLRAHYRSPIEVTPATLADAEKALARLDGLARRFASFDVAELLSQADGGFVVAGVAPATGIDADALATFRAHMDDDLDTPGALATVFELASAAHSAADADDEAGGGRLAHTAAVLAAALGLSLRAADLDLDEESARLMTERDEARRARDFARADALRDELVARGWTVEDTPSGTAVHR
jgi:cysteinyl-tRNA synthetase